MTSTQKKTVVERAEALSEEVLESVRDRQQSMIEAMRKFVDRLDDAMPSLVDPSVRKKVVDAIGDYYEQLAATTNEFVARMVRSTSGTLKQRAAKPAAKGIRKKAAGKGTAKKAAGTTKLAAKGTTKKAAAKGTTKKAAARPRRRQPSS
jgi:DNA-binding PucR family transcriptional regulator